MSRHSSCPALVVRLRQFGESNREAFFITPEAGIVRAAVYGGPKSKLRAYVSPFQTGTLYLYRDGVRESNKVTDFDVINWRPGLRESLERSLTAAAIAEAVLASGGGGSEPLAAYNLVNESLDALQGAPPENCDRILVYFLWHWLDILGLHPAPFDIHKIGIHNESDIVLNGETLRTLSRLESIDAGALEACLPDAAETGRLKQELAALFLAATGKRLRGCGEFAV